MTQKFDQGLRFPDLENKDPRKITWKWLKTANNILLDMEECKKQYSFQWPKSLTRIFVFQI